MFPAPFTYHRPESLQETLALLASHGDEAKLLAGGHSLLPTMKLRLARPMHLIDMKNMRAELQYIREDNGHIAIGALTTYSMLLHSDLIQEKAALLAQTIAEVGDIQVRNVGTLGGSIAHADPAADPPAAILAAEASMVLQGSEGKRTVSANDFFQGFFETAMHEEEILTEIRLPVQQGGSSYQKFKHPASGYAVVAAAVVLNKDAQGKLASSRIALTGFADRAYRAEQLEAALEGQELTQALIAEHSHLALDGIEPLEDAMAAADYRSQLAKTMLSRALLEAWQKA